jgi:hypothetical protein
MSNHRLIGSKGYALGGSRAEPWALLPSLVPPGPETDMRSLHCRVFSNCGGSVKPSVRFFVRLEAVSLPRPEAQPAPRAAAVR